MRFCVAAAPAPVVQSAPLVPSKARLWSSWQAAEVRAIESETVQHLLAELPEYGTRFNELNDDAEGELDPFEAASALAS